MKKTVLLYIAIGFGILINTSCSNNNKPQKAEIESLDIDDEKVRTNNFESTFSTPSPQEIFTLFEDSDIKFNPNLLPNTKGYEKNITSSSLSNNLGVYIADVAYLNMFNQYALMTSYLESIFNIADELDLTGIYTEFDFKKVFKEMDNPDSLEVLSDDLYLAITNYMTNTGNEANLCLVYYSSYIELLYLVMAPIEEYNEDLPILQHIILQREVLKDLYEFAQNYKNNQAINNMLVELKKINKILSDTEITKTETQVTKTEEGKMSISGGTKYQLTEDQFILLKNSFSEIRNKMVN